MDELKLKHDRSHYGRLGGWLSVSVNIFLFFAKIFFGFLVGSVSLIADAFHTLSDLVTSFIVLFSFKISEKPSDARHPFGHGRAELISAIVIATIIAVTGIEVLKFSIDRILHPAKFVASTLVIIFVLFSIIVKEALAIFTHRLSKKIDSPALKADAFHHHQDAFSSLLVVIAFIFSHFNFPYLDAWAGVIIALVILYSGYEIARSPIDNLLGVAPDEKFLTTIEEISLSHPLVQGVHDIILHQYGEIKILSFHIEVPEHLSLDVAHEISDEVNRLIREKLNAYVTIHVDPVMKRTQLYKKVENSIKTFCEGSGDCGSFHDLRVFREGDSLRLAVDLAMNPETELSQEDLAKNCKNYLLQKFPRVSDVKVKVEPIFSVSRKSRNN